CRARVSARARTPPRPSGVLRPEDARVGVGDAHRIRGVADRRGDAGTSTATRWTRPAALLPGDARSVGGVLCTDGVASLRRSSARARAREAAGRRGSACVAGAAVRVGRGRGGASVRTARADAADAAARGLSAFLRLELPGLARGLLARVGMLLEAVLDDGAL